MYIEDLIQRLAGEGQWLFMDPPIPLQQFDTKIVHSLSRQISMGSGFTEKQAVLAVKLVKKYEKILHLVSKWDILAAVANPQYKLPIRVVSTFKTVRIIKKENTNQRVISVCFPFNEELVQALRAYKEQFAKEYKNTQTIQWNPDLKSWDFTLREEHVSWIAKNIINSSFTVDDAFTEIYNEIQNVEKSMEQYVPIVSFEENKFIFKNVVKNIPQPSSDDIIDVLMQAKKYGINYWDEEISEVLDKIEIDPFTKSFLETPFGKDIELSTNDITFKDLLGMLKYNSPTLVVIPGGSELKFLRYCMAAMMRHGISSEEMSVLFRLDGQTGKIVNDIIKDSKVNNPITEKIRFFFVSGRVPKPLIESNIKIESVLNFGLSGVHYTLSNYLKNHHFVVNYKIKEPDFASM